MNRPTGAAADSPDLRVRAVVLTGGRSRRFGGVHKPAVLVRGVPVLTRLHTALLGVPVAGVWIAGPLDGLTEDRRAGVHAVQERPRFAGPLAGIGAALATMPRDPRGVVLLLAGDVPFATPADLARLAATCAQTGRASGCTDAVGRFQHLSAAWPEELLRTRLATIGSLADTPVHRLWDGVDPVLVPVHARSIADFDTPEDLQRIVDGTAPDGA